MQAEFSKLRTRTRTWHHASARSVPVYVPVREQARVLYVHKHVDRRRKHDTVKLNPTSILTALAYIVK
jgi:hypothetical protein